MDIEERLINLESKLGQQDYLLDVLNKTVYEQQKKLDELEKLTIALAKRISDVQGRLPDGMAANEKPPHY